MSKFIKLTDPETGKKGLVNIDRIVAANPYNGVNGSSLVMDRFGDGFACILLSVTETPEQILALIEGVG